MPDRVERRLAAVLAADMVGYSRLMEADEAGTIARQKAHRKDLIDPRLAEHRGRVVKTTGDGLLVEFASAVDAVAFAVAAQRAMSEREAEVAEDRRIAYRIGINLGDIVIDGDDILGDGVNVAARLETLAEPGGICISGNVHELVAGKLDLGYEDLGDRSLKNISREVRVYRVRPDGMGASARATAGPAAGLELPDKPSIAVLPFQNMSGDADQEYFADGIAEDIITGLSRVRWFFVIARNSSFTYKGKAVDVTRVAREMGVRYVLEGSVRKSANRVRITVQLIDATTGNHLWAERYDRELADIFAVQDEITETVVATIEPQLYAAESARAQRKPPNDLDAWDLVMRAMPHLWRISEEDNVRAREMLETAVERDPDYAGARGMLAYTYMWHAWMGWGEDPAQFIPLARESARAASELDGQDPWAHLVLGTAYAYAREHGEAIGEIRKALDLNPSFSLAHAWLGTVLGYAGESEEAIAELDTAGRISPRDPFNAMIPALYAIAHFAVERYQEAWEQASKAVRDKPDFVGAWRMLVISCAHLGRIAEARDALAETRRLQPGISLAWARDYAPWIRPDDLDRYVEGLRLAGLE